MHYVWYGLHTVFELGNRMNRQEWTYVFFAGACVGAFFLRGFGKRL